MLRVSVEGGGLSVQIDVERAKAADDLNNNREGGRVIDPVSVNYMAGPEITR